MKKTTAILLGSLIASSAALAQDPVLSRNAVGYIKIPLQSNSLHLVSNPFFLMGENDDLLTNVFASVANGSTVSVWNEDAQSYNSYLKNTRGAWAAAALTVRVSRADAAFIRSAGSSDLFFMGEVPDSTTAPVATQSRANGITMLGFPYPVTVQMTNTSFATSLPNNSTVSLWNDASQQYNSFLKNSRGAWAAGAGDVYLNPGQGVVIRSTAAPDTWDTIKTNYYTWP